MTASHLFDLSNLYCLYWTFVGNVSLYVYFCCLCMFMRHEVKYCFSDFDQDSQLLHSSDCFLLILTSLSMGLTACTPRTALGSQEQQKRFSPCCMLSPPPPPLFPPPPSLWRRNAHVSRGHVTFYCGISVDVSLGDIQTVPRLLSFDPWMTPWKHSDGGTRLQEDIAQCLPWVEF